MDAFPALHALVASFTALAAAAILREVARRPRAPEREHTRRMLLAWWGGALVANASAAIAFLLPGSPIAKPAMVAAILGGVTSGIAFLLHLLYVYEGDRFGGRATLLIATTVASAALLLGFSRSPLAIPSMPVDTADIWGDRAILAVSLVIHGIPLLGGLGLAGLALDPMEDKDRERVVHLAAGLVLSSAGGIIGATTALLDLPGAHAGALILTVVGTALCATYYIPPTSAIRWRAYSPA